MALEESADFVTPLRWREEGRYHGVLAFPEFGTVAREPHARRGSLGQLAKEPGHLGLAPRRKRPSPFAALDREAARAELRQRLARVRRCRKPECVESLVDLDGGERRVGAP